MFLLFVEVYGNIAHEKWTNMLKYVESKSRESKQLSLAFVSLHHALVAYVSFYLHDSMATPCRLYTVLPIHRVAY